MSADSAVTYTSVHSEARSWSIPFEDPYEEAAQQLLERAPRSLEESIAQIRATVPSTYHSLLPLGTPPLLPIPLHVPSTSRRAEILEANTPPRKRLLLTALEMVNMRVSYQRLAYEQESIQTHEALARSEAYSRTLEVRVAVLETQACRHDWQRQTADDFYVQHIMRTQSLEAGARIDTLEDAAILYSLLSIKGNSQLVGLYKMAPKRITRSTQVPPVTAAPTTTTTTVTEAQLQDLINQGVVASMAEAEASRVRNGYDNNGSGPRLAQAVRECTYPDFLKCYSRCFQELALMCDRMFPEESDWVEKYIGRLPDTIHDSVKSTKPKTIQEAIEFATELMDKRIHDAVENKQKFEGEKLVSWSSKKQDCTALSTAEAEYVSLFACCAQVLWMQTQITNYGFIFKKIPIYCDSKSAIAISCNPVQHSRTKHIAVHYYFIKEHVEKGTIELYFVKADYQLADIFTKAFPADRFNYLVRRLGMHSLSPQELKRLAKSQ
nr:retrovirus-related Pol polyprotein from transposon TNT 1-94 [Tanacetum cinerariifolium]